MEAKTVHAMTSYTYEEVKRAYDSAYGNIIEVHLIQGVLLKMSLFELSEIKITNLSDRERKYIEWGLINEVMVPDIPEPEDGVDYYLDELLTHTVAINSTSRQIYHSTVQHGIRRSCWNSDSMRKEIHYVQERKRARSAKLSWLTTSQSNP